MSGQLTDREFLLAVLQDGREHTLNEIIQRSFRERGCGLTVHSRAAELRKSGYVVLNRPMPNGGRGSVYQLLSTLEAPAENEAAAAIPASPLAGASSVDDQAPSSSSSSGRSTDTVETSTLISGQLVLNVPVSERERDLHVNGRP